MTNPSPLRYPGGKNSLYPFVLHLIKSNTIKTYIEPFAGGAAIPIRLIQEGAVDRVMINDVDRGIYNFWCNVLKNTSSFIEHIDSVPITVDEWRRQKRVYNDTTSSDFDIGFATFYLNRTNRSGIIQGGPIGGYSQESKYLIDCRFNKKSLIDKIKKSQHFLQKLIYII